MCIIKLVWKIHSVNQFVSLKKAKELRCKVDKIYLFKENMFRLKNNGVLYTKKVVFTKWCKSPAPKSMVTWLKRRTDPVAVILLVVSLRSGRINWIFVWLLFIISPVYFVACWAKERQWNLPVLYAKSENCTFLNHTVYIGFVR